MDEEGFDVMIRVVQVCHILKIYRQGVEELFWGQLFCVLGHELYGYAFT